MSAAIPVPGAAGRMRGARRAYASRANRRSSRGPKTAAGRQRDASAPFRHGLSLPVLLDAALAPEIDRLAREIISTAVGGPVAETHLPVAIRIAEAMIDLRRVRLAKRPLWVALEGPIPGIPPPSRRSPGSTVTSAAPCRAASSRSANSPPPSRGSIRRGLVACDGPRSAFGLAILAEGPNWDNSNDFNGGLDAILVAQGCPKRSTRSAAILAEGPNWDNSNDFNGDTRYARSPYRQCGPMELIFVPALGTARAAPQRQR